MRQTCVHCTKAIRPEQAAVKYPLSRRDAHLQCVSLPSFDAMDLLIIAYSPVQHRVRAWEGE